MDTEIDRFIAFLTSQYQSFCSLICIFVSLQRKRKISEREQHLQELTDKKSMLEASIASASKGKKDSVSLLSFGCFAFPWILYAVSGQSDRKELLEQLAKEQTEHDELTKELAIYSACDPDALKAKRKKATDLRDAANRWTAAILG